MISIKDMAGLIDPLRAYELVRLLKAETGLPVDLHTHCTPGLGVASMLMAMVAGVDIVDTVILSWSGGPAGPAYEIIQLFADRMGRERASTRRPSRPSIPSSARSGPSSPSFDQYKANHPPILDLSRHELPAEDAALFDHALEAATSGKAGGLPRPPRPRASSSSAGRSRRASIIPSRTRSCEKAQIPGRHVHEHALPAQGSQAREAPGRRGPRPRTAGAPRLRPAAPRHADEPDSRRPGGQLRRRQGPGQAPYTNVSKNFAELVGGSYGKTPWPIDPAFRKKICGYAEEKPYDVSAYAKRPNPALPEFGGLPLAKDEKEELLLELFPSVAEKFLKGKRRAEWDAAHPPGARKAGALCGRVLGGSAARSRGISSRIGYQD